MAINMGKAVAFLELNAGGFKKGFQSAFDEMKKFRDETNTTMNRIKIVGDSLAGVGRTMTLGVTAPIVGVGTAALRVGNEFESGMSEVQAISGATGQELDKLKEKAKQMGAKTKFSAKESADAFKYMAMAGWDTEDMLNGIGGIMDLAAASGEDLALTSDIVTDSLTAFGLKAEDAGMFADVLARASSRSNTNVSLMGNTFQYVAPVAGALGYSIQDTAVAIGLMANAGIKGEKAGTALRAIMTRLVSPTKQSSEAMEALGISVTNSDGTMKPLSETISELREKMAGMSESEKTQTASALAGQEAMSGLLAIINASDEDFQNLTSEIDNSAGAAEEMADIMMNNTKGAIEQLKGSLETAGIVIHERLSPYIKEFAEKLTELVDKFNNLDEKQQDLIIKIGLIIAAIGPVLWIVGGLIKMFSSVMFVAKQLSLVFSMLGVAFHVVVGVSKVLFNSFFNVFFIAGKLKGLFLILVSVVKRLFLAFKNIKVIALGVLKALKVIINPITIVIGLILTFALALKTLWQNNEEFRDKVIEIWNEIKDAFSEFTEGIKERLSEIHINFETVTKVISIIWQGFCEILAPVFIGAFQLIADMVQYVLGVITGFVDILKGIFTGDWETIWLGVKEIFGSVWQFITDTINNFGTIISDLVNVVLGFFGTSWQEIWQNVCDFFTNIWNNIISFFTETIPAFIDDIVEWFETLPKRAGEAIGRLLGKVYLFGQDCLDWVQNDLPEIIEDIIEWFATLPSRIWEWLVETKNKIVKWGSETKEKAKEIARGFVNKVIEYVKELPDKVWNEIKSIPDKVADLGETLKEKGKEIIQNLWDGITEKAQDVLDWFQGFADSIGDFVGGIVSGFTDVVNGADEAKAAASSVDGSHKGGLSYVPYNGYIAELHEGERVLTKEENKSYNKMEGRTGGDTYILKDSRNPRENARAIKRLRRELIYGF